MTFITDIWFKFITNIFKIPIMTQAMHSFDALALLRLVPSETSIPSYCNIFIIHTNIHLKIFVDEILYGSLIFVVFLKTDLTIIVKVLLHFSLFQRFLLLQTVVFNLHLHLPVLCVLFHYFLRLNTLTFMFLTTSGTHNFAYGSLILLQLPLHLFTSTLSG